MRSEVSIIPSSDQMLTTLGKADSVLHTDFCPWANRYVYWLRNPFWILLLATVGSIACAILVNPLVFALVAILVLVTSAGVLLPWNAVRGIECHVAFDVRRTRVGQPAVVRLRIRNRWPIPVWGLSLIRGFAHDATIDGDEGVALARVPGWSSVEYSWVFIPRRRGRYPAETAEVETGFPFGLFQARKSACVDGNLIVWPATARLGRMSNVSESRQTDDLYSERRVGDFGDTMGARPFRDGDSLRRVHWAQTARQQMLIVSERQAPAMASVRIVVDLSQDSHPAETAEFMLERCVQAAASICESLHRQHSRIEMVLGDDVIVAGDAPAGFHRMMDALAVADVVTSQRFTAARRHGSEIRVTTSHGFQSNVPYQVVIDADGECSGAWIALPSKSDLSTQFPKLWMRACHVV